MTSSLELPVRPARRRATRTRTIILVAAAALLALSWYVWFINTPTSLETSSRVTTGSTVVGKTLYFGMYSTPPDSDRSIRISGIKVEARSNAAVEVEPLLCRGGSIGLTTAPEQFCDELVNPEGEEFTGGDSIVLGVTSDEPAIAEIDRIRVGFHEDLRSGTHPAGRAGAIITINAPAGQ